jgi:hypothetical protein
VVIDKRPCLSTQRLAQRRRCSLDDPLRECLDHVIVFDERHLLSLLRR